MKKCINFLMSFSIIVTCTHFWSCTHSPSDTLNESPFSSILSPANNTIFVAGDSISISMDVKDDDGRIVEVRLFMDSVKVCSLNEPYFYMLDTDNFSIGKHVLKIEAEDNDNSVSSDSIVIEMAPITFGSYFRDCGQSISSTQDGGYIIAGYTEVYFSSINQLLVKTDKNGSEEWTKIFGDSSSGGMANSVIQNVDGAYIITGSGYTNGVDGVDVSLIKTNYAGNEVWSKTFGGSGDDHGMAVSQTSDGGYIIAGYTTSFGAGEEDAWLIKTDASGNEEWNRTFGGTSYDAAYSVIQTADGGFIISGDTGSSGTGYTHLWLIKTDISGMEVWNKTYTGHFGKSIQQTSDGGFVITGHVTAGEYISASDLLLLKTDINGNEEWSKTFGSSSYDYGYSVKQTSDNGYIVAGTIYNGDKRNDVWLIKTDPMGNEEWNRTYGGQSHDYGYSVTLSTGGGYALTGSTSSYGAGGSDMFLVVTDNNGNLK